MKAGLDQWLILTSMIVFGAIVHATAKLKVARDKNEEFTALDYIILIPLSMFSGIIFGLVGTMFSPDNNILIILFAAMGSFLGISGLNKLSNVFLEVLSSRIKK